MYKSFSELGVKPEENRDLYSVVEISDAQHKNQILNQNRIVLVDIFTHWCGPCKKIEPEYSLIAAKYNQPSICAIVKEDLEKKITSGIHGVPTFHLYKNGQLVDEIVGADLPKIEARLQELLQIPNNQFDQQEVQTPSIPQYQKNNIRHANPNPYKGQSGFSGQPYQGNPSPYHQPYQGTQVPQAPHHQIPQTHQYQGPTPQSLSGRMQSPMQGSPQGSMYQSRNVPQIQGQSRYPSPNVQYNQ